MSIEAPVWRTNPCGPQSATLQTARPAGTGNIKLTLIINL